VNFLGKVFDSKQKGPHELRPFPCD